MISQKQHLNLKTAILLAQGFEEGDIIFCLDRMREAGLAVSLVSLSAGLVSGAHGVTIRPDCSLAQLLPTIPAHLVIIPGGRQCMATLLTDPRVYHLLKMTLTKGGYVAAMVTTQQMLVDACPKMAETPNFIRQDDLEVTAFVGHLIELISV